MQDSDSIYSRQFIAWEVRGRGWTFYPEPVDIEPPFRPFDGYKSKKAETIDDGRRETGISRFFSAIDRWTSSATPASDAAPTEENDEPLPRFKSEVPRIKELTIILPPKVAISAAVLGRFLGNLQGCAEPISFEMIGTSDSVTVQLAVRQTDSAIVHASIRSFFPDAVVTVGERRLQTIIEQRDSSLFTVAELGLQREFMIPLATFRSLDSDPLIGIAGALACLEGSEAAIYQVLFQPVRNPWAEHAWRSIARPNGQPFFLNAGDLMESATTKFNSPLYSVVVRVAVFAPNYDRIEQVLNSFDGALSIFENQDGNSLLGLEDQVGPIDFRLRNLVQRSSCRTGMLLNREELMGLAHLPSSSMREPKLLRAVKTTRRAPSRLLNEEFKLGINEHDGEKIDVGLTVDDRTRHMHVLGASGAGKSTFLLNCMMQDVNQGTGFALLDPAGDLVDRLMGCIPPERRSDVILFDPSDEEFSVGLNLLSAHSELERNLLASDLTAVFRRQCTSWGDVMNGVMANAILAFLESSRGGTLADLCQFLVDDQFRKNHLNTVTDVRVRSFWQNHFPTLQGRPQASIVTRLDGFLRYKSLRYMVSQKENRLNFQEIMDSGRIFLARLPKGLIGEENAHLLGALLLAKFQQATMSRQSQVVGDRREFFLYLDEFADMATPSVTEILNGARKYRVGLTLAHQDLRQLQATDDRLHSATLNCHSRVFFRINEDDARRIADGFTGFSPSDFTNLNKGEAICKVGTRDASFNITVPWIEPAFEREQHEVFLEIRDHTRRNFAKPRSELAALEELAFRGEGVEASPEPSTGGKARKASLERALQEPKIVTVKSSPISVEAPEVESDEHELQAEKEPDYAATIKNRIVQKAGALGFSYDEEQKVLDGKGKIDLVLVLGALKIAIEIGARTTAVQEVKNIRKCLDAHFTKVISLCNGTMKRRGMLNRLKSSFTEAERSRIHCVSEAQLSKLLEKWSTNTEGEQDGLSSPAPEDVATEMNRLLQEIGERKRAAKKKGK